MSGKATRADLEATQKAAEQAYAESLRLAATASEARKEALERQAELEKVPGSFMRPTTQAEQEPFNWTSAAKLIEWSLLFFILLSITSKIIKGIPPSDNIKFVMTQKPKALWVYAILSYIIIILVKVISNRNTILETPEELSRTQKWWQILNITIYFIIVILAYSFCLSYLAMKVRRKPIQIGGFFDWMDKGKTETDIDPAIQMIILIGIIFVLINSLTNLYLYLRNRDEAEKDNIARIIYQSQLATLLIMILTIVFLIILGSFKSYPPLDSVSGFDVLNTARGEIIKVIIFILFLVLGGILVNLAAESERTRRQLQRKTR
tara:strand:- start:2793 stop:3755 length:963 start_codon:yes stop_codon:yes gene_type:complete